MDQVHWKFSDLMKAYMHYDMLIIETLCPMPCPF